MPCARAAHEPRPSRAQVAPQRPPGTSTVPGACQAAGIHLAMHHGTPALAGDAHQNGLARLPQQGLPGDRKSTRLNSSHLVISYAVFCLKKKKTQTQPTFIIHAITTHSVCSSVIYMPLPHH